MNTQASRHRALPCGPFLVCCAVLLAIPASSRAQPYSISSYSSTAASSVCDSSPSADSYCHFGNESQRLADDAVQSRLFGTLAADETWGNGVSQFGTASHAVTVTINGTSTQGNYYVYKVHQRLKGDLNRRNDEATLLGCFGRADISGVSVSVSGPAAITDASIPDPGELATDSTTAEIDIDSEKTSYLIGTPGSPVTLTFTWTASVRSNSCEAAVRLGSTPSDRVKGECEACRYPGTPERVQTDDGHEVEIYPACGDGVIDSTYGEECDGGACCTDDCKLSDALCDDGNDCTGDSCQQLGSVLSCEHTLRSGSCDDGVFCNGTDSCVSGECSAHSGDPCDGTSGAGECAHSCNELADACTTAEAGGTACTDDGNPCTTDVCSATTAATAYVGFTAATGAATASHEIGLWGVTDRFSYGDFASTSGMKLLGDATVASSRLRLTQDGQSDALGAAWYATPIDVGNGFATFFTYRITTSGVPGDGFAFVIQSDAAGASAISSSAGGGLGYGGIANSVAIEFDTYANDGESSAPRVSVQTRGTAGNSSAESYSLGSVSYPAMTDGSWHTVIIKYVPGALKIWFPTDVLSETPDLTVPIDLGKIGLSGTGTCTHPAGNAGTTCRASAGECDVAEACDGASTACPSDAAVAVGTTCGDDGNACTTDLCSATQAAYLGFTGATGELTSNHDILAWSVTGTPIQYGDFGSTSGLSLVGSTTQTSGALRLTGDSVKNARGAVWYASPATVDDLDTTFAFRVTGSGSHADGFAFVIQSSAQGASAISSDTGGGTLGYGGITNSLAVELDTFRNTGEPATPFVSVQSLGAAPNSSEQSASLGWVSFPSMTDGNVHKVRVTYSSGMLSVYLDGVTSPSLSVAADLAALGLQSGVARCAHAAGNAGTTCRASAGACDVAESCTGTSATCPADAWASSGSVCRAATGACDVAEVCDGSSVACPGDAVARTGTVCRASSGMCDTPELCDGASASCPSDALAPAGTECRSATGACDVAETCSGASAICPSDALRAAGTPCRPSAGVCDLAESCTGTSDQCPSDAKSTAVCRASTGACDLAESCDGIADACPADALAGDRDLDGECDALDPCTNVDGQRVLVESPAAKLVVANVAADVKSDNDKVTVTGALLLPSGSSFAGLTPASHGARIVLRNDQGEVRVDATLPGDAYAGKGTRGWALNKKSTVWQYRDTTGAPVQGITGVKLTDDGKKAERRVSVKVTGRKGSYPVVASDDPLNVVLVLGDQSDAVAGRCAESTFGGGDCSFNRAGTTLTCK